MANNDIHIGFDMDGVLVDHTEWKLILARQMGFSLTVAQTASEMMRKLMPIEQYRELQRQLYSSDEYGLSASVMPGAVDVLSSLRVADIPFTLISRRKSHDIAMLLMEKLNLRPEFFRDENTFFVERPEDKDAVCAGVGVTHYLDDEVRVLSALTSVPNRFLMDPHGTAAEGPWTKVSTLAEFRDTIVKL